MSIDTLEEIFHPQSVAVVGASNNPAAAGYNFTRHLLDYGYQGKIYPVNPHFQEIFGVKAYPSLRDVAGSIDYVISCIPSSGVLDMMEDCSRKGVCPPPPRGREPRPLEGRNDLKWLSSANRR